MLPENFIVLGALLSFYGGLSYLIDTIKGRVKPNRITWFLWALAPLIAFAAEREKGVGLASLMTFMVGFNPLMIFIASFINKKSYWKLQKFDYVYGLMSIVGLILWKITGEGNLAIFFAILADALASIPTVIKAYKNPETESTKIYLFACVNSGITLLTLKVFDLAHLGFPLYIFTLCALMYSLVKWQWGVKLSATK
jgi:hypothetical protein